jgi:ribosomal protein L37AE/L43A
MSDEEAFGMFWWYKMLEEEEQKRRKHCPNCESQHIRYDEDHDIWVCLDCNHEWKNDEF